MVYLESMNIWDTPGEHLMQPSQDQNNSQTIDSIDEQKPMNWMYSWVCQQIGISGTPTIAS